MLFRSDNTLEQETVTVRDRDTMEQITIPVKELAGYVRDAVSFSPLGQSL